MARYEVEFYKVKDATPRGEYQRTELDDRKDAADILIEAVGCGYTIKVQNPDIEIKGRGVKATYPGNRYAVTEAKLNQLQKEYNVKTDF